MPLPLPNLDDRTYADLVEYARSLIPNEYPEWTDHNPSDTGIILIELLAWLTELVLYRVDQVPNETLQTFLVLLNGPDWPARDRALMEQFDQNQDGHLTGPELTAALPTAIRQTVLGLRKRHRAASAADYEYLTLEQWPHTAAAQQLGQAGVIKRAHCLPQTNLTIASDQPAPGHVSLVIVPALDPEPAAGARTQPVETLRQTLGTFSVASAQPTAALKRALWTFLDERRLLTTRHHVVGPDFISVGITATLVLADGADPASVRGQSVTQLRRFFHPLSGGDQGQGWPFGRSVYLSEIYEQLDRVPGVDYVETVQVRSPPDSQTSTTSALRLSAHQLVAIDVEDSSFTLKEAWEAHGS